MYDLEGFTMMINKMKRIVCVGLTALLTLSSIQLPTYGIQATSETENGIPEGIILNYREMEEISQSFAGETGGMMAVRGSLPTSYSASSNIPESIVVGQKDDHVSPVKSQSPYGTCWAHSAMSLAESSYIINKKVASDSLDLNEYHLVHHGYGKSVDTLNLFGGDYIANGTEGVSILEQGGNNSISLCVLASWQGASDSSQSTFGASQINNGVSPETILGYDDAAHLENAYVIAMPDMTLDSYETDMNIAKQMIMNYGSIGISYYSTSDAAYFSNYHQYVNIEKTTNHAVTVVGWNDTIAKDAFPTTAPGDGAWLVKNSWGTGWGNSGYFWLSYYDATISSDAYVFDFAGGDNYDNNYQYDGGGYLYGSTGYAYPEQICGANAFVADSNETIEAIGFYTRDINIDYEIRIYRGLEKNAVPNTGTLVYTQSGTESYMGFHTVKLNSKIALQEGERYGVVITLSKEGDYVVLPVDKTYSYSWVEFYSYAKAGESYYGTSVDRLSDLNPSNTDYASGMNVRIKAFTNERTEAEDIKITSVALDKTSMSIDVGDSFQLNTSITPTTASNIGLTWSTDDSSVATVDENGKVTAVGAGTTVITATAQDGSNKSASCTVTVNIIPVQSIAITYMDSVIDTHMANSIGDSYEFSTNIYPSNASIKEVTWSSSDTNVATVNDRGVVAAVGGGTAYITATAKDGSGISDSFMFWVPPKMVESVEIIYGGNLTTELSTNVIGQKYDLDAVVNPSDATDRNIEWYSSNEGVATVDSNGVVTTVGVGETSIIASSQDGSGCYGSCNIVVHAIQAEQVKLLFGGKEVTKITTDGIGENYNLEAKISPSNVTINELEWLSLNPSVAVVDMNGRVTTVGYGSTTIMARTCDGSGVIATCVFTVNKTEEDNKEENKDNDNKEEVETITISAPKISTVTNLTSGIKLKWNKISGATGYVVYRKNYKGRDSWKKIATINSGSKITYTDKSVKSKNGSTYSYRVCALKGTVSSKYGKEKVVVRLSKPSLKSVKKISKKSIKCNWTKTAKVTGYNIRLMVGNKLYKTYTIKNNNTTAKTIKGLTKGKKYKVQIRSYKKLKGVGTFYSSWSNTKTTKRL